MEETRTINPLMDFARKVECSVKLPSNGNWYDNDNITFNALNEVDVMPMLPNDEIMLVNPETLITGETIIKLIKSCCPGIKNPEELYYPDVNTLLLGIKKATSGDEMIQPYVCPNCWEKKVKIENEESVRLIKEKYSEDHKLTVEEIEKIHADAENNCKSKIAEMEKNNELLISSSELKISSSDILSRMKLLPKESIVETKEGLKIYVTPFKCIDKIIFSSRKIKLTRMQDFLNKERENFNNIEKLDDSILEKLKRMSSLYEDISDNNLDIISSCIKYIKLPNGDLVTNKEHIKEFTKNISVEYINSISNKITELNLCGIQQSFNIKCDCCGHEWEEKFYGFNQNDFFGISS